MKKENDARTRAVRELAANEQTESPNTAHDECGPEPERPSYYSTQAVRDRYYQWKLCASGAG